MIICKTIAELQEMVRQQKANGKCVGFVPTMGALHEGHLSLVGQSQKVCDFTVVSIFVNPTQFNNPSDFTNYPIRMDEDKAMLEAAGTDVLFLPSVQEMYPQKDTREFDFDGLDLVMEGKFRPGHFNGVAQIVSKLFDAALPDKSFFGQKDFQQLAIIRHMTSRLNYPVEIMACPIIREPDGLALSSRNLLLSPGHRKKDVFISQALLDAHKLAVEGSSPAEIKEYVRSLFASDPEYHFEYFEIVDTHSLRELASLDESSDRTACIAVYVGEIRLIDNYPGF